MAKPRRRANVKLLGVVRRQRRVLLMSTALCATVTMVVTLPAAAQLPTNAHPTGGAVVGGNISINQSVNSTSSQTTINQTTQRGAINWQTFNVGSQSGVTFNQPSSTSVTLNEVQGANPSRIAGQINANGQIVIENPDGVVFYKGAQVNTAGLMVSAATSSPAAVQSFINGGNLAMDQAGNPNARIVNRGQITVSQAGLAALVAPQVRNSGIITAQLGHIVLAGATHTTLDLYGDKMMSIDVTGLVRTLPNGATALVTNVGTIIADGGTIQLTARAVDGLVQNLVDAGGLIRTQSVGAQTGKIVLNGVGGSITIDGQLDATGQAPGTTGGAIVVNPSGNVTVKSGARIDASGYSGGGVVALGTTLKRARGGPSVTAKHTAANVTVQHGATIAANATHSGNGGRITVLSTNTTDMEGAISATGGPFGGNGGFVELSGGTFTSATGVVDTSAPFGNVGTILLDPDNLDIVASGGNLDGSFTTGTVTTGQDAGSTDSLSAGVLDGFTGNVLLQALHTVDVQASFSISSGSLTMQAGDEIIIEPDVVAAASGNILLAVNGAVAGTPATSITTPSINIVGTVASSGGSVSLLAGQGGTVALGSLGLVSAPASGQSITIQTDLLATYTGRISAPSGTVEIAPATPGNALAITSGSSFGSASSGTLDLATDVLAGVQASVLRLGAATIGGTQTTTAGAIMIGTNLNLTGIAGTLDLHTTGNITRSADTYVLTVGTLTGNAGGDFNLAGGTTGNIINTVGSFSVGAGNQFVLLTSGGVNFAGPINAGAVFYEGELNGGNVTVSGSIGATTSVVVASVGGSGTLGVSGTIASPSVELATTGSIQITGSAATIGQTGGTLVLSAPGGVTEVTTGTIAAGTIAPNTGLYGLGTVSLLGTANAISNLGSLDTTGDFALVTKSALTVADTLMASGSIYLQSSNAGGITVASTGSVLPGSGKLASFQADAFANSGTVVAGTVEIAPYTNNKSIVIGSGYLPSLAGINATMVRVGAVTLPGSTLPTVTAGSITVSGPFGNSSTALELDSNGGIDASGGALTASTLSGSAAVTSNGNANFSGSNTIATLGNFVVGGSASSGDFNLLDTGSIAVSGSVAAADVGIIAGTIGVSGNISAPGGSLDLSSNAGAIALTGSAVLNGGTMNLASHTTLTEMATSKINAGIFSASAGAGGIALISQANTFATIAGLIASGGGVTVVTDPTTVLTGQITGDNLFFEVAANGGTLQIGNGATAATMSATAASNPTISLVADNITEAGTGNTLNAANGGNSGTIELAPYTSGTAISLGGSSVFIGGGTLGLGDIDTGTAGLLRIGEYTGTNAVGTISGGNISIASSVSLGGTVASTLELDSTGSITEPGSAGLSVGTLTGTAATGVSLAGSINAIGTLGAFGVSGGNFTLASIGSLTVAGPLGANNISLDAGTIGIAGLINAGTVLALGATGGVSQSGTSTISAATLTSIGTIGGGLTLTNLGNHIGTISGFSADGLLAVVDGEDLTLTGLVSAGSAGTIDLSDTGGGITQAASGTMIAGLLTSSQAIAGSALFTGSANQIGTIGYLGAAFTLAIVDTQSLELNGVIDAGPTGTLDISTTGAGSNVTQTGGHVIAGVLISSQGVSGSASFQQSANSIGRLGNFGIGSGGTFVLVDSATLAVTGLVGGSTAAGATIAAAAIGINGGSIVAPNGLVTLNGTSGTIGISNAALLNGGTVDLNSAGAVTEDSTSTLIAATLQSSGGFGGTVDLLSTHNSISAIGNIATILNNGEFLLQDAAPLTIAGTMSVSGSPQTWLQTPTLTIASAGLIDAAGHNLMLSTDNFSLLPGGSIEAYPVVFAPLTAGREILLGATSSSALSIASFSGINANYIWLAYYPAGNYNYSTGLDRAISSNIVVGGSIAVPAGLGIDTTGGISQTAALTTTSAINIYNAASVVLLNPGNSIPTLSAANVGGSVQLVDGSSLTASGIQAGGNIFIQAPTIDVSGTLTANTTGTIGLQTDSLSVGAQMSSSAFELAPLTTGGTVTLGATGSGLSLLNLGSVTATAVRIGAVTLPGSVTPTVTAGSIIIAGPFGGSTVALELDSLGGIGEANSAVLTALSLTGSAGATVSLGDSNAIGTLGAFGVTGGDFSLTDAGSLAVAGPVSANNISLDSGTIGITGLLNAGTVLAVGATGSVSQAGSSTISAATLTSIGTIGGGLTLNGTANTIGTLANVFAAGLLKLTDNQALTLAGGISAGSTGTLDITTTGGASNVTEANGASLTAGLLTSSGGISGSLLLSAGYNEIGTIGAVTASGTLAVVNQQALTLAGLVSVGNGGTLDLGTDNPNSNVIEAAGGTVLAGVLTSSGGVSGYALLQQSANQIGTISGFAAIGTIGVVDSQALTLAGIIGTDNGTLDLSTTSGSVVQAPGGQIQTAILTSGSGIAGSALFTSSANQIGTIANLGLTGTNGTLAVVNGQSLALAGSIGAGATGTVDLGTTSGGITQASNGTLVAGVLTSSGGIAGAALFQGTGNQIGTVRGITATGTLALLDTQALSLAGVVSAGSGGTLDISTTGAGSNVTQAAGGTLIAGVLTSSDGIAGSAVFAQAANQISTISNLSALGTLAVVNSESLTLAGLVSAGSTGSLDVSTTAGSVTQGSGGTIVAGTFTSSGSIAGDARLLGTANQIGTISGVGAGGTLQVVDSIALMQAGSVFAPTVSLMTAGLTIGGSLTATTLMALGASANGITEVGGGVISTPSLVSIGTVSGNVALGNANNVGTLGNFAATGGFNLVNAGSVDLAVAGTLGAASATVTSGTIGIDGSIIAPGSLGVTATAAGIALNGGGLLNGGTVDLSAPNGGVAEATGSLAGTIIAGTLLSGQGVQSTASLLSTANQIGTLGAFDVTGGDLQLADDASLAIGGAVSAQDIFIKDVLTGGTITLASGGTLNATNTSVPVISLIADHMLASAGAGTIGAAGGTVALAPFTPGTAISLDGISGSDLVLGGSLLAAITTGGGTLQIGSYNDVANGGSTTITAGAISVDGPVDLTANAATLRLDTTGSITESATNAITVGTLIGTAAAAATLGNANTIAVLGSFSAAGFTLNDAATTLTVNGPVNGGTSVSISDTDALVLAGTVIGSNAIALSGSSLAINGFVNGGTTANTTLTATNGGITEGGTIATGTLYGSATGSAMLTGASATANQILNIGSFSSAGFVLNDGTSLGIIGGLGGGLLASIVATGVLTVGSAGVVNATTVDLTGASVVVQGDVTGGISGAVNLLANTGSIAIPGTVNAGTGTLSLIASNGAIGETGTLIAGTLNGSSAAQTSLTGTQIGSGATATFSNQIGTLGSFSADGFTLRNGVSLDVAGGLGGGASAVILVQGGTTAAALTVHGIINASSINLTAYDITIPGDVAAGNTGTISLVANGGTIGETGTLLAGTLMGSATGAAVLSSTTIGNLVSFSAGTLSLDDTVALTVIGTVSTTTGSLFIETASSLTNQSLIQSASGAVTLQAATDLLNTGSVVATNNTVYATATTGTLTNNGLIQAGGDASLQAGAGLNNGGSVIATNAVLNATDALSNTNLVQASANATLTAGALSNSGSVFANGGNALLTASSGTLDNGGLVQASSIAALQANSDLTSSGSVITQHGSASLVAVNGSLTNSGLVQAATNATLQAATNIVNTVSGSVKAQGGLVTVAATSGTVSNAGLIQADTGAMLTGPHVANTGSVLVQAGDGTLTATAGTLSNGGLIQASGNGTLTATAGMGNTGSVIAQGGSLALTVSGGALSNGGLVQAHTSTTLMASGNIANTSSGSVLAQTGSLSVTSSGGTVSNAGLMQAATGAGILGQSGLFNTGSIIALGNSVVLTANTGTLFNSGLVSAPASSGFVDLVANDGSIVQSGAAAGITAGAIYMSAPSGGIWLDGLVKDASAQGVRLTAGGTIYQDGTLIADLLTGSAGATVDLAGATPSANQVADLGSFTVGSGGFTLNNGASLLINGTISAATIHISDTAPISLGNAAFVTGGAARPATPFRSASALPPAYASTGAYLSAPSVIQTGSFTVSNLAGVAESILEISLAQGGGTVSFSTGSGLQAASTWLILELLNGHATGQITVQGLDVVYTTPGSASFSGVIDGSTGSAAAGVGNILPQQNANYRVNGCAIGSVNCVILAAEKVPQNNPINEIVFGTPFTPNSEDLVLPVVSDERYELNPCNDPNNQQGCPAPNPSQH